MLCFASSPLACAARSEHHDVRVFVRGALLRTLRAGNSGQGSKERTAQGYCPVSPRTAPIAPVATPISTLTQPTHKPTAQATPGYSPLAHPAIQIPCQLSVQAPRKVQTECVVVITRSQSRPRRTSCCEGICSRRLVGSWGAQGRRKEGGRAGRPGCRCRLWRPQRRARRLCKRSQGPGTLRSASRYPRCRSWPETWPALVCSFFRPMFACGRGCSMRKTSWYMDMWQSRPLWQMCLHPRKYINALIRR